MSDPPLHKPVSAYALFFRDTQAAIKSQNPGASFGDVSKIVASMWDGLDPVQKDVYKKKTEAAKKEYLKQLAAYRASQVSQQSPSEESPGQPAPAEKSPSPPNIQTVTITPPQAPQQPTRVTIVQPHHLQQYQQQQLQIQQQQQQQQLQMQQQQQQLQMQQQHQLQIQQQQQQQQYEQMEVQQMPPQATQPQPWTANRVTYIKIIKRPQSQPVIQQMHHQPLHQQQQQPHQQLQQQQEQQSPPREEPPQFVVSQPSSTPSSLTVVAGSTGYSVSDLEPSQTVIDPDFSAAHDSGVFAKTDAQESESHLNMLCVRTGCKNLAVDNPGWDAEYCSNECVVSHCRDIFTAWVAARGGQSSYPVK